MTENELKQELSSMKKCDLLHLIEELMEDNIVDITDINLCHTRALESKLAAKDDVIKQADICIFESVFTDSLGKPADDRALLRKLEWMDKVGMHNMEGILEYLKGNKKIFETMKAKVDLEKFICSYVKWNNIQDALKDQGLKCWRGEIVEIPQESKDERIKKEILDLVSISGNGNQFEEIKDWLEKQGEQETDEWKEGNIIRHGGILALVIRGRRVMKSNGEIFTVQYPDEWVKAAPKEIEHFLNEFEKQGEQKPTKYTLEQAAHIFLDALSDTPYNNSPITDAQVITNELLKFLSNTSSYNPNTINEQKPVDKVEPKFHEGGRNAADAACIFQES